MSRLHPEIRIHHSKSLHYSISKPMSGHLGFELPSEESVEGQVEQYQEAWTECEQTVLNSMQECFKVSFYKNIIDVHIAPYVRPISSPLIIHTKGQPDEFVNTLTHELLHVLLTDNNSNVSLLNNPAFQKFNQEERVVRTHVPVFAGLKHIYLDTLKAPERLERDMQLHKKLSPGYTRAWEIVDNTDYEQVINDFAEGFVE